MVKEPLIFVVDDDQSARRGLARLLRAARYDVRDYASVREFLDSLDPEATGCLVLDARMPGLSGEELVAELDSRDVHLPIIIVTGDDDPETRRRAQRMRAAGLFGKPVDGSALLDAIKWALEQNSGG